ncbi:MAG TPA: SMP-30/gluconolactonase/LRE family protein [Nitrospira sp.]|nr:SMP-30/gluconolactonase/LRE family protein [Nitrospira sp.]
MRARSDTSLRIIETVVGSAESGFSGDGGPAVCASLNEPKGLAFDERGNLIIADSENHVIRMVDCVSGMITTIVGLAPTHAANPGQLTTHPQQEEDDPLTDETGSAAAAFAQQADLSGTVRYVVNREAALNRFGGDGGPALHALLHFPTALACDRHGHLYIADQMNHRIRRVDKETGIITTIAGVGHPRFSGDGGPSVLAGLNEPAALALSLDGTILYVADQSNHRIRAIDLFTGTIRTVAGTGISTYNGDGIPALEATLAGPSGLAMAPDGTLYIADTFNGRIRTLDPVSGVIHTIAGDGGEYRYEGTAEPPSLSLARPSGIAVDIAGNLYVTDSDNHLVRRWRRETRRLERVAGTGIANFGGDGGPALDASLRYPFGILLDDQGHLFVADTFNHRIRKVS